MTSERAGIWLSASLVLLAACGDDADDAAGGGAGTGALGASVASAGAGVSGGSAGVSGGGSAATATGGDGHAGGGQAGGAAQTGGEAGAAGADAGAAGAAAGAGGSSDAGVTAEPAPSAHPSCSEVECIACEAGQAALAVAGACCPDCVDDPTPPTTGCSAEQLAACPEPPTSCPPGYSLTAVSAVPGCCQRCKPEPAYCQRDEDCAMAWTCLCCPGRAVSVRLLDDPCVAAFDQTFQPGPECNTCGCGDTDVECPDVSAARAFCGDGLCRYELPP